MACWPDRCDCNAMPELPDVTVYVETLRSRVEGRVLREIRLFSPFVLRSVEPPLEALHGEGISDVRRIGKRIVFEFAVGDLFLVVHLMIAGRLRWRDPGQKLGVGPKLLLARFEFEHGTLLFTEAASKKRASLQVVRGD